MKINKNIKIAHLSFDLSAGAGVYITRFHKFLHQKKLTKIFTNSKIKGSNIETIISHNFF